MLPSEPGIKTLRPTSSVGRVNLRHRRTWFAKEDSDGSETAATDTQPVKKGSGSQDTTERTFTQADLDLYLGNARKQARDSALNELLKELDLEKLDDLKMTVTTAKAKADAEKSDLEKAQTEIERWKTEAETHKAELAQAQQERMEERRQSAILSALTEARVKKASDLLILINARYPDDVVAAMSEDGTLDEKAIKKLVEMARKEWADQFQSSSPGSPSNAGGKTPAPDKDSLLKTIKARI